MRLVVVIVFYCIAFSTLSQQLIVGGEVLDKEGNTVPFGSVVIDGKVEGELDSLGRFQLTLRQTPKSDSLLLISSAFKKAYKVDWENAASLTLRIEASTFELEQVNISNSTKANAGQKTLEGEDVRNAVHGTGDVTQILQSMGAAIVNNELSSSYSVRGGNYDENLVYVNGFEIYRPQIVKTAQQDGLSFVNPQLVQGLNFYGGGWDAGYGDKLSSVLDVKYMDAEKPFASFNWGLLGGAVAIGTGGDTYGVQASYRQKRSQYLLNTLQVEGQYFPKFDDVQLAGHLDVGESGRLDWLGSYARNRFELRPETRTTSFGTSTQILQLEVAYEGEEFVSYDTYQGGLRYTQNWSDHHKTSFTLSGTRSEEEEIRSIWAGYKLCELDVSGGFDLNQCLTDVGFGREFEFARNYLSVSQVREELKGLISKDSSNWSWEYGFGHNYSEFSDILNEYTLTDSAGFIESSRSVQGTAEIAYHEVNAFAQGTRWINQDHFFKWGVRTRYNGLNERMIVSPRLSYVWGGKRDGVTYSLALGHYGQQPLYRELRDFEGVLNTGLRPQQNAHVILSRTQLMEMWDRDFVLKGEIYGKYGWDVVPYDFDELRMRYYATNNAKSMVIGGDVRINGEFIENAESWFSVGVMTAREKIDGTDDWQPRPTDQRLTVTSFFQDNLPNNPSMKVSLTAVYGSGFTMGIAGDPELRNAFRLSPYRRVDIGFSKRIGKEEANHSLWLTAEVLNLLGISNEMSSSWFDAVDGNSYAVPNYLSARFVNVRLVGEF